MQHGVLKDPNSAPFGCNGNKLRPVSDHVGPMSQKSEGWAVGGGWSWIIEEIRGQDRYEISPSLPPPFSGHQRWLTPLYKGEN